MDRNTLPILLECILNSRSDLYNFGKVQDYSIGKCPRLSCRQEIAWGVFIFNYVYIYIYIYQ
jgi:hypothetical protein